jgi:hypothetical protein
MTEKTTAIATYDEELARYAKQAAAQERPQSGTISLRGGVMTYMGQQVKDNKLPCIILAAAWENAWYSKPFDSNNIVSPDCYALGRADGDEQIVMRPAENSANRQGGVDGLCLTCPKFQWGSDPRPNSRGKACKERRRLVVLPLSSLESADALAGSEMAMLTVSVTNVANWAAYTNKLAAVVKRPTWAVISEISMQPHPRNQFQINFTMSGLVDMEDKPWMMAGLKAKREQCVPTLLQGYDPSAPASEEPVKARKY